MAQQQYTLEAVRGVMLWTMIKLVSTVRLVLRTGGGKHALGYVAGREQAEDERTDLDEEGNQIYVAAREELQRLGLALALYSEHGVDDPGISGQWYLVVDPIGGTTYVKKGFQEAIWSVWTIFDASCEPVLAGAVDARSGDIYLTFQDGVRFISTEWAASRIGEGELLPKPNKETLDSEAVISAFLGDLVYSDPAARLFRPIASAARPLGLGAREGPRPFQWHAGGESTGPYIASGKVHAYVSACEPRQEIDPWLGFQAASGFFAGTVNEDKSIEPYEGFVPGRFVYGRIPLFIAASTERLASELVRKMPVMAIRHAWDHYRARYAA